MKDLLDKLHHIIDTLSIIVNANIYKIYTPDIDYEYNPFIGLSVS